MNKDASSPEKSHKYSSGETGRGTSLTLQMPPSPDVAEAADAADAADATYATYAT